MLLGRWRGAKQREYEMMSSRGELLKQLFLLLVNIFFFSNSSLGIISFGTMFEINTI